MKRNFMMMFAFVMSLFAMTSANAAIDVSGVVSEIKDLATPIASVGAAMLLILVAIKGWKVIRRAM